MLAACDSRSPCSGLLVVVAGVAALPLGAAPLFVLARVCRAVGDAGLDDDGAAEAPAWLTRSRHPDPCARVPS